MHSRRETQSDRLLKLLKQHALFGDGWVPLPEIMNLRIASFTRRVSDLRKAGHDIQCQKEWIEVREGIYEVHSKYRLVGR